MNSSPENSPSPNKEKFENSEKIQNDDKDKHSGQGINIISTNEFETNNDNNIILKEDELLEVYEQEKLVNNAKQDDVDDENNNLQDSIEQEMEVKIDETPINDVNNESLSINISTKGKMKSKKSKNGSSKQPKQLEEDVENYEEKVIEQIEHKRKLELSRATEKMQAKMLKIGRCPY